MELNVFSFSVFWLLAILSNGFQARRILKRQTYEYFTHPVTDGTWFIDKSSGKKCFKQGSTIFVPRDDDQFFSAWVPSDDGSYYVLNDQYKWNRDEVGIWYPQVDLPAVCNNNLIASVVVFRHGERTPRKFYPNDPYKNRSYWSTPLGELSNNGILQAYNLGKWVRQRYASFLPKRYSSEDFFIYSSGIDRTLMSASAFSSGLYPISSKDGMNCQPVPVHSKPPDIENTVIPRNCPKYDLLLENLLSTNFIKKVNEANTKLFAYMSSHMGMPVNTFVGLQEYYDTFFIEELNNLTLPDWSKAIYPHKLRELAYLNFLIPTYTPEMSKFRIGCMYSEIINYFQSFTNKPPDFESDFKMEGKGRKLLAISGHSTNIVALLNTLKVPNINKPPFSSAVIFELSKDDDAQLYVSLYYKNVSEVQRLKIEGCGYNCGLNSFIHYLRPITMNPKLWTQNCEVKSETTKAYQYKPACK